MTGIKTFFLPPSRPGRKHLLLILLVVVIAIVLNVTRPWQPEQRECSVTVLPAESIQAAIEAAEQGDVICLPRGAWTETIVIDKSLTIVGRGTTRTSIEADWRLRPVLAISGQDARPVTVKIEGLTISWDGGHTGVAVNGTAVVEISNCHISGMMYGIQAADSAQLTVRDSAVTDSRQRAIMLSGAARASISGCQITGNVGPGLWLSGSAQAAVSDCAISGNVGHGLWLRDDAHVALGNCAVSDNRGHGLFLTGRSTAHLLESGLSGHWDQGIRAEEQARVEVIECTVLSNWHGVELRDEAQATITGSTISSNSWDGIRVRDSGQAQISGSVISANGRGVGFSGSAGADIRDCLIEGNSGFGVFSWASGAVGGEGNEFRNNGIDLGGNLSGALRVPLKEPNETAITWPDERYASLQEAVDALLPGGKLVLAPDTYAAGLTIGTPLSIEAGDGQAVLSGGSAALPVLSLVGGAELHLTGCMIAGGAEGLLVSGEARAVLAACTISGNTEGINLSHSASAEVMYCDIEDNERRGVFVGGVAQAAITSSSIRDNGGQGIAVGDSAQVTLRDSIVAGSGGDGGLVIWASPQAVLEGNIISDNRGFGIAFFQRPCFVGSPWVFRGRISGSGNLFETNRRGDVCPPELEFLATAEGGELDLRP